jgi:cation transport regulator ChaB
VEEEINNYLPEQKSKLILYQSMHSTYKKTHASAIEQYQSPEKRRGGKKSAEEVAHKAAWAAIKKKYNKKGNEWVRKAEA